MYTAPPTANTRYAHTAGISTGKYRAYQELLAVKPDAAIDEIREMSMREIRDLIAACQPHDAAPSVTDPSTAPTADHGNCNGNGNGHGGEHGNNHN